MRSIEGQAILLQELQHCVANSLQINTSALMQSSRKAPSDETRNYLRDAQMCELLSYN
jgi:two-component sensor histidine kinase